MWPAKLVTITSCQECPFTLCEHRRDAAGPIPDECELEDARVAPLLYVSYQCQNCGASFIWIVNGRTYCPYCKSTQIKQEKQE